MKTKNLTFDRLHELLIYDKETGVFTWKNNAGRYGRIPAGSVAGTTGNRINGYVEINIDGVLYKAHRLAWLYVKGEWPAAEIDHENRKRDDNRFLNLRQATQQQNLHNKNKYKNNTSGIPGVTWHRASGKWQARIGASAKRHHLGYFKDIEQAAQAYKQAKSKMHTIDP